MRPSFLFLVPFMLTAAVAMAAPQPNDPFVTHVEVIGRTPSDIAVERVELQAVPVALEAVEGALKNAPADVPKAIAALQAKLAAAGLKTAGAPFILFASVSDERFTGELQQPLVAPPKTPVEGLRFGTSPARKALRIAHKGPLSSLEDTYFELQTFVEDGDFEAEDQVIERYMTDPAKTAPNDMVTEIYLLLK